MDQFLKLFSSQCLVDVLMIFLTHPNESYYQSYIVKTAGYSLMQIQRALKRLEESGLINKNKLGNRFHYSANNKHPAFEDIKRAFFKQFFSEIF